jgi:uncharacterized cupredoxin-like copper-binding protein
MFSQPPAQPRQRHSRRMAIGGVIVLASVLAACGDDDEDADSASEPATAVADTTEAPATTANPAATTAPASTEAPATTEMSSMTHDDSSTHTGMDAAITVNAVDYAFEDLPATVPAGTKLAFHNTSTAELHELVVLGPIPAEETRSVEELLALPEDQLPPIEPVMVALAPPGEEGMFVVGDGTVTEPGRYAVICAIPIGADPAEFMAAAQESSSGPPEVEGGPPHFTAGMYAELIVE